MSGTLTIPVYAAFPLVALLAWLLCLTWHWRENRQLSQALARSPLSPEMRRRVMLLAIGRSFQLLLALGGTVLIIGLYEWKLRENAAELSQAKTALEASAEAASAAAATHAQIPPAASAHTPQGDVAALFSPTAESPTAPDALKARYEELFITYQLLRGCNLATDADYAVIRAAFSREAARANAPAGLEDATWAAAQGSYREIYANNDCASEAVQAQGGAFRRYINGLPKE